ncbi:MAG: DNA-processing protein DprA [Candidatus Helarchaeota archaeon]
MKNDYDLFVEKRHLIDYIYLLRALKLSKPGIIKLFKDPKITISHFKDFERDKIVKYLSTKKNYFKNYEKIEKLFTLEYCNENYKRIEDMVNFCELNDIKIYKAYDNKIPKIFKNLSVNNRDLIFIKGSILDLDLKSYSICGSRTPTPIALQKTRKIARYLSSNNFTLINGFARGIDIEAFKGTADVNGRYIAILASGIENIYPPEHKKFVKYIVNNGALVSQRLIWKQVNKLSLQIRNRLSAKLSLGTIFIEGNYKSGTKWQLKFAKEADKPIFYLEPENWDNPNSHILNIVKNEGGHKINKDLSNLDEIKSILEKKYLDTNIHRRNK